MEPEAARMIGAGLAVGGGLAGAGIGIGTVALGLLQGMARNPELEGALRINFFIGLAFAEAIAIYGLVIGFLLLFAF